MHTQTGPFGPTANSKKNLLARLKENLDWVKVIKAQEIDIVKLESLDDDDVYCSKRSGLCVRLLKEQRKKVRYYMEPILHEVVHADVAI